MTLRGGRLIKFLRGTGNGERDLSGWNYAPLRRRGVKTVRNALPESDEATDV